MLNCSTARENNKNSKATAILEGGTRVGISRILEVQQPGGQRRQDKPFPTGLCWGKRSLPRRSSCQQGFLKCSSLGDREGKTESISHPTARPHSVHKCTQASRLRLDIPGSSHLGRGVVRAYPGRGAVRAWSQRCISQARRSHQGTVLLLRTAYR